MVKLANKVARVGLAARAAKILTAARAASKEAKTERKVRTGLTTVMEARVAKRAAGIGDHTYNAKPAHSMRLLQNVFVGLLGVDDDWAASSKWSSISFVRWMCSLMKESFCS